jgi:hypothetical protein
MRRKTEDREHRLQARAAYIASRKALSRVEEDAEQLERTDDADAAFDKMDTILRNATYSGPDQIPAFMVHIGEVIDNIDPWHRSMVNFEIFQGNRQAWMESGDLTILEATGALGQQAPGSSLVILEPEARPPLPEQFLTVQWREWAEKVFQEDSYDNMWVEPDSAVLHPEFPW